MLWTPLLGIFTWSINRCFFGISLPKMFNYRLSFHFLLRGTRYIYIELIIWIWIFGNCSRSQRTVSQMLISDSFGNIPKLIKFISTVTNKNTSAASPFFLGNLNFIFFIGIHWWQNDTMLIKVLQSIRVWISCSFFLNFENLINFSRIWTWTIYWLYGSKRRCPSMRIWMWIYYIPFAHSNNRYWVKIQVDIPLIERISSVDHIIACVILWSIRIVQSISALQILVFILCRISNLWSMPKVSFTI